MVHKDMLRVEERHRARAVACRAVVVVVVVVKEWHCQTLQC